MQHFFVIFSLGWVMVLGLGCSPSQDAPNPIPTATPTEQPLASPYPLETRLAYEADYEALRTLYREISAVWQALDAGQTAQCGQAYDFISPTRFDGGQPLDIALRWAANQLIEAVELWRIECQTFRREVVPPDVIAEGLGYIQGAEVALDEALAYLADFD